ncbi:MAG: hypothetical protein CMM52_02745 [Rhodospirillaceae bacterium]|nr:hypothetical protein [Rhodospirillaceae bacterium]|tara:strand:- start:28233 stop:28709 length:477 start_codon:yes stop_codon:yes gene_type:complete
MSDNDRDRALVGRSGVTRPQADDALPPHPNELAAWLEADPKEREKMPEIELFLATHPQYLSLLENTTDEPEVPTAMTQAARSLTGDKVPKTRRSTASLSWLIPNPATGFVAAALIAASVSGFSMGSAANQAEKFVFNAVATEMTFGLGGELVAPKPKG